MEHVVADLKEAYAKLSDTNFRNRNYAKILSLELDDLMKVLDNINK